MSKANQVSGTLTGAPGAGALRRWTPFVLLALVLTAAAWFVLDFPTFVQAEGETALWSSDITVVELENGAIGAIRAGDFSNQGGSAGLTAKWLYYYPPERKLRLSFSDGASVEGHVLQVGDFSVAFTENDSGNNSFTWDDVDVDWENGQTLAARIVPGSGEDIPATGLPTISGRAQVDETLSADTSDIADEDGLDSATFSYQWQSDGSDIELATGSSYTPVAADLGKAINVKVSFTDEEGNSESLTSEPTKAVIAANTPATGEPTISGTPTVRQTLTAGVSTIADQDGITAVSYAYQWLADDVDIDGATGSSYELTSSDVDKTIQVRVSFTDDADNEEKLTSVATGAVAAGSPGPPVIGPHHWTDYRWGHQEIWITWSPPIDDGGAAVTSYDLRYIRDDASDKSADNWTYENGLTGTSYTVDGLTNGVMYNIQVRAVNRAGSGAWSATFSETPRNLPPDAYDVSITPGNQTLTVEWSEPPVQAQGGVAIANYVVVHIRTGVPDHEFTDLSYWTASDIIPTSGPLSYTITGLTNGVSYFVKVRSINALGDISYPSFRPFVLATPNSRATGLPTIIGTPQVGQTLTADTSNIADEDGLTNVSYEYQWKADVVNIVGATGSTYVLANGDAGKTIQVKISFTDDRNNAETLTSEGTVAATATVPSAPQSLTVTSGSQTRELDGAWQAPSSNGGSAVTGYKVQWKESTDSWDTAADVSETTETGTTHTITSLTGGVEYAVRVIATNVVGDGPASTEARAIPADSPASGEEGTETVESDSTAAWTATLTVGVSGSGSEAVWGYSWFLDGMGTLDGRTYSEGDQTIEVMAILLSNGFVAFNVRPHPSVDFVLTVDGTEFASADASEVKSRTLISYVWATTLDWAEDDRVALSLTLKGTDSAEQSEPAENTPATGLPTISGTPQAGQTLTANTTGIVDEDGLDDVDYSYQWIASDGNGDTDIADATDSTYTPSVSDVGKTIKVKVIFTDDADNQESLTSTATAAVAATVSGAPQNVQVSPVGASQALDVTWEAPASDGGSAVTGYGYKVQWKSGEEDYDASREATVSVRPSWVGLWWYRITGLTNGSVYTIRVIATNSAGGGLPSTEVSDTPLSDPDRLRRFIAVDVVEAHESSHPWLRTTWDYMKSGVELRIHYSSNPSGQVSTVCSYDDGLLKCRSEYMTIAERSVDSLGILIHEMAHVFSLTNGLVDEPAPLGAAYLYFDSLGIASHASCRSSELFADILQLSVVGASANRGQGDAILGYWERCNRDYQVGHADPLTEESLTVVRSALSGQMPQWFVDTYHDSNGNADLEQLWSDVKSMKRWKGGRSVVAYRLRDQFGGYCGNPQVSAVLDIAIDSERESDDEIRNPWKDSGCVPEAPGALRTVLGNNQLELSWEAPVYDGGSRIRGYAVEWKSGDEDYHESRRTVLDDPSSHSHTVTGLTEGVEHTFRVTAFNVFGDGEYAAVTTSNSPATGLPTISGTALVGETLTASTSGIADEDGLSNPTYSYQWIRNDGATDSYIQDATSSTYTLTDAAAGKTIKVRASFADDKGNGETLTSDGTAVVAATVPGVPEHVRVTPHDSQALDVSWEAPPSDGGSVVTGYKVQWKKAIGSWDTPEDVSEAIVTGSTHTIPGLTEGTAYSVRVLASNEVGDGTASAEQAGTPRETTPPSLSTATVNGAILTLTYDEALDENSVPASETFSVTAEDAPTTVDSVSVSGSSVTLTLSSAVTKDVAVTVSYAVPTGLTTARIKDLAGNAAPALSSQAVVNYTGQSADYNSALWSATMTVGGSNGLYGYESFYFKMGALSDKTITLDGSVYTLYSLRHSNSGSPYVVLDRALSSGFLLRLDGFEFASDDASTLNGATAYVYSWSRGDLSWSYGEEVNVSLVLVDEEEQAENTPPTGLPTITGTAQVGQTLMADVSDISDTDGLDNVDYSYQWTRSDNGADTDIAGATDSTYTLVSADQGNTIKVKVSFTDDADNDETLTSAATEAVAAKPNTAPTGLPTISGTPQVDQTLTADTPGITDEDGLTNVSYEYEWLAGGSEISGATGSSYLLTSSEQGQTIQVRVTFTDDADNAESLTSVATVAVAAKPNTAATGEPTISGTPQIEQTLTADTSAISDANGLNNVSYQYQWLRDDADIAGQTNSTYQLVSADEGQTIKVRVTFNDDAGNAESLTSTATTPIAAQPAETPAVLLTASFTNVPADHNGSNFTFQLIFSENVEAGYARIRDHAFTVSGATIDSASRITQGSNQGWNVEVNPTGNDAISITLPETTNCSDDKAICTDDERMLSHSTEERVEGPPAISVSDATVQEAEGATLEFSVTLSHASSRTVTVSYATQDGTATAGPDYTATSATLTFNAGDLSQTVEVTVLTDSEDEGQETLTLTLSNPSQATLDDATGTGTIENGDSSSSTAVNSPPNGLPTVSGTPQVGETLTAGTSAISDEDGLDNVSYQYQWLRDDADIAGQTNSTYRLVSGDQDKTIRVRVTFRDDADNAESLTSAATTAVAARPTPTVLLTASFANMPADHNGSSFTFQLIFSENVEAGYARIKDDAFTVSGATIDSASRTTQGSNQGWNVEVNPTGNDAISITLPETTDCSASGAICTDDERMLSHSTEERVEGPPAISVSDATVQEAEGATLEFNVTLSHASSRTVTVSYATQDGTATAGPDYTATSATLTFNAGDLSQTVEVTVLTDSEDEGQETLTLTLSNPSQATLDDATGTGTIENGESSSGTQEDLPVVLLTGSFSNMPATHNGSAFTFDLSFSENVKAGYARIRDHAFTISGASTIVSAVRKTQGSNQNWTITVQPNGNDAITITLPPTTDCDADGAVCTAAGRKLSNRNEFTVSGPGG